MWSKRSKQKIMVTLMQKWQSIRESFRRRKGSIKRSKQENLRLRGCINLQENAVEEVAAEMAGPQRASVSEKASAEDAACNRAACH